MLLINLFLIVFMYDFINHNFLVFQLILAYCTSLKEKYPRTYSSLNELRQFVKLMNGDLLQILDDNVYRAEFNAIQLLKLQLILKKFKDKSKDSEVKKLLKKLKERN